MPLPSGTLLGPYQIVAPLGAGGMGEVYRARDTKLDRDVALKVLPDLFASDPERLARFEREAKTLASLNHPHIAQIYGVEESSGVRALVMELVEGEDLSQRLARGAIRVLEALAIATQIAEALEAAHELGIVHRDLKPANIKLRPDGTVKVLDFGLAKSAMPETSADTANSPTFTVAATQPGVVVGTAGYMAPEQARGKAIGKRADVWAFGCVLYEMLTGRQAFAGNTVADVLAAVIGREPDWTALPEATPAGVRRLLHRCLRKDAHRRLQSIGDVRLDLEDVLAAPGAEAPPAPAMRRPGRMVAIIAVAALAAAAAAIVASWQVSREPSDGAPVVTRAARLTAGGSFSEWPAWSPDGNMLAFASNRSGNFEIYVRRSDGGQEINVSQHPADDFQPAFSPDGKSIAFVSTRASRTGMIRTSVTVLDFVASGGDLWVAPTLGGPARRLAENANAPDWHPDGRRIAYVSGGENHRIVVEVPADGGASRVLLNEADSTFEIVRVQYSPSGRWLALETTAADLLLLPSGGGRPTRLLRAGGHIWWGPDRILYLVGEYVSDQLLGATRLESARIDTRTGAMIGSPETLTALPGAFRHPALSPDGSGLALTQVEERMAIVRAALNPAGSQVVGNEQPLTDGHSIDRNAAVSPDGRTLAYTSNRLGRPVVWIRDLLSGREAPLQLPGSDLGSEIPFWSPDGRSLATMRGLRNGLWSLWIAFVDGSKAEQLVPPAALLVGPYSPAGTHVVYQQLVDGRHQLFVVDLATRQTRQLTAGATDKFGPAWSPDGRWIAYTSVASGMHHISRMPAAGGDAHILTTSAERLRHLFYSPDGRWLYFQPSHRNIFRLPASGGPIEQVTRFPESGLFLEEPAIWPDGQSIVYSRSRGSSTVWTLTIGRAASGAPP